MRLPRIQLVHCAPKTRKKTIDRSSGLVIREDRFLNAMWPQVGEIHDLHFGPPHGTFFYSEGTSALGPAIPASEGKKEKVVSIGTPKVLTTRGRVLPTTLRVSHSAE
jgi:hypothetical protein